MRLRDGWMASRAAAMAARPGLSTAASTAVREDDGKGEKEDLSLDRLLFNFQT
jgi:hypothetical protein